jgi:predicted small metal-binding protein
MPRQYVDCREIPSDTKCTVAIAADSESELIEAAVQHAVAVHGHTDTPEFRKQLASAIKKGTPPIEAPAQQAAAAS